MITVLYVNHGLANQCGVRDFGIRHHAVMAQTKKFCVHYAEVDSWETYLAAYSLCQPDTVIFNYMAIVMPWLDDRVRTLPAVRVVVQHLYDPKSVTAIMESYKGLFDYMVCLDPDLTSPDHRIFFCGRPIHTFDVPKLKLPTGKNPVQIGSFGFGMPHKQFPLIMREINRCFDHAVFNLHMTVGDFVGDYSPGILSACLAEITKPGIKLNHTSEYLDEADIIEKLSRNHMNALFYSLPPDNAGRSSSLDYMIAAQRPVLVTDCGSFKHAYNGTYVYPHVSFDTIAGNYQWCASASVDLYERNVGRLLHDTEKMLEAVT